MLNPADWQEALKLFDLGLTKPESEREQWLTSIDTQSKTISPIVRKLLNAHARVETKNFFDTLPRSSEALPHAGEKEARIGPFILTEIIGQGGMGSVWRARYSDDVIKRDVAIKLPALGGNGESTRRLRERFSRERDFLAQLEHAHIARLYDAGVTDNGQPYLALEYVRGMRIDAYCDDQKLPIRARVTLFLQVLDAVAYAHRQLILHRDIKPGNVLVDASGAVKLLDFGVAKILPPEIASAMPPAQSAKYANDLPLTEIAGAALTLAYAAPEQITAGKLTTATDVYALGVMLYRILSGASPYKPARDTRGALEEEILQREPLLMSKNGSLEITSSARSTSQAALVRALAGDLDLVIAKALKKESEARYPTADAFADDLRRYLNQEPISARPDSLWYRAERVYARHKLAVVATALGATAIICAAGIAVWQASVANANAARATKEATRANAAQKFFAGMFANADPEKNKNITPVDRQIVDRALATAERDFATDPDTLTLILKQLGEIYFRQGIPEKYLEVQKKRVALVESRPIASVDDYVDAQLGLGQALDDSPSAEERAQALPRLLAAQKFALERNASDDVIVRTLCFVADQYLSERKLTEARAMAKQALIHAKKTLPNPSVMLAFAYQADAQTARDMGDFAQASASYKSSIAIDQTGRGRGKLDELKTRVSFAAMLYDAAEYLSAKNAALDIIHDGQAQIGDVGLNLAQVRRIAVNASERAGDKKVAKVLADTLLKSDIENNTGLTAGSALVVRGITFMTYGNFAEAQSDFAAAELHLQSSLIWQQRLATSRGELMLRLGDATTAENILRVVIEKRRNQSGSKNNDFSRTAERLAVASARLGKKSEAQKLFEEACSWRIETRAQEHPDRIRCEAYIALIDEAATKEVRVAKIAKLRDTVAAGRSDHIALIPSLEAAAGWLESSSFQTDTQNFPLLN